MVGESVCWSGHPITQNVGSCNGTIIIMGVNGDAEPIGSCHGGETINEWSLEVDGQPIVDPELTTYEGDSWELHKISTLAYAGRSMTLDLLMECDGQFITETGTIHCNTNWTFVNALYPFCCSHSNAFTEYIGIELDNSGYTGSTDDDDNVIHYFPASKRMAQYDPLTGVGVSTVWWTQVAPDDTEIWDRSIDNKLYWRQTRAGPIVQAGWEFSWVNRRQPAYHANWPMFMGLQWPLE